MFKKVFLIFFVLTTTAGFALSNKNIQGVWSTKQGCERLNAAKKDATAHWTGDYENDSYLSSDGIHGYEWQCEFVKEYPGKHNEMLEIATCNVEGNPWPELIMLEPLDGTGWAVIFKNNGESIKMLYDTQCEP